MVKGPSYFEEPDFVSEFEWGEGATSMGSHDLAGQFMCGQSFVASSGEGFWAGFYGWGRYVKDYRRKDMGFISHHEIEWGLVSDRVRVVIVSKFGMGDVISPGSRVVSTEDLKVCFNFLVYPFSSSVRLGMIGCGEGKVVFQESSELSSNGGCKLGTIIRYDFAIEAKSGGTYTLWKKRAAIPSVVMFFFVGQNQPLSKPMVDHDQEGIKAGGRGKVGDEVTKDLLEGIGYRGANGGEQGNSGMCVCLILLTGCAAFNIFMNIRGQPRPPEFGSNKLVSFQVARVASGFVIVPMLEDGATNGFVIGDIDTTLVG